MRGSRSRSRCPASQRETLEVDRSWNPRMDPAPRTPRRQDACTIYNPDEFKRSQGAPHQCARSTSAAMNLSGDLKKAVARSCSRRAGSEGEDIRPGGFTCRHKWVGVAGTAQGSARHDTTASRSMDVQCSQCELQITEHMFTRLNCGSFAARKSSLKVPNVVSVLCFMPW